MKIDRSEMEQINLYTEGIEKFLAIAVVLDNRGESNLQALLAAKETLFDLKDWMSKNTDEED